MNNWQNKIDEVKKGCGKDLGKGLFLPCVSERYEIGTREKYIELCQTCKAKLTQLQEDIETAVSISQEQSSRDKTLHEQELKEEIAFLIEFNDRFLEFEDKRESNMNKPIRDRIKLLSERLGKNEQSNTRAD